MGKTLVLLIVLICLLGLVIWGCIKLYYLAKREADVEHQANRMAKREADDALDDLQHAINRWDTRQAETAEPVGRKTKGRGK